MAVVSAELPIGQVFEIAGPLVTARCTSVCTSWREAAEQSHVWRVHVETTCGRAVATALDELRREGRTSLTFKELIIKRWRSNYITAASSYTWSQVVPPGLEGNERHERRKQLAERFRLVLLEASLVQRQTGARMAFVTVPMDEAHIRRLFTNSGLPMETSGVPFPGFALSEVESINDCSIVLTLYDLAEAHVAKIMTAHFADPASSDMADNGVSNFVSHDLETVMGELPWPEYATARYLWCTCALCLWRTDIEDMADMITSAAIENLMGITQTHSATVRLHPVLLVADDLSSIHLRFQFVYWENESDGEVQEFNVGHVRRLLDRLLVEQAVWV